MKENENVIVGGIEYWLGIRQVVECEEKKDPINSERILKTIF